MDFLDPKKQRRHTILLYSGYVLIAIGILISTIVLIYQANGFGVNNKGQVVQNGLVFFSSQPSPATIYLNGQRNPAQTNSRLSLAAGQYAVRLTREGYRDWQRQVNVQGGDVQHFDYPVLFPKQLTTKSQASFKSGAGLVSQSRDLRWLVVQAAPGSLGFNIYDLKNDQTPATALTLPASVVRGAMTGSQSWAAVQWADDNTHLVVKHSFPGGSEYIELDRSDPAKAVNLNQALGINPADIALIDNKYDQFSVLSAVGGDLSTASLSSPALVKQFSGVYSFKTYGSKQVLYSTAQGAPSGTVGIYLFDGDKSHLLRTLPTGTTYPLQMAGYDGKPYVVLGAASEGMVYIYQDPLGQLQSDAAKLPRAIRAMKVPGVNYVSFSPNTQYIMAANGNTIGVYDIYLKHSYVYTAKAAIDAPQPYPLWMDGNRLTYVSGGKSVVFDYDNRNVQTLMAASPNYAAYFSPNYHYVYALAPAADGSLQLTQTALLTAADL